MILPVVIVLLIVSVPLLGGDLRRVGDLRLRWTGLALVALLGQILVINVFGDVLDHSMAAVLHVATYVPAGLVAIGNRRVPGVLLIAIGGAMNFAAIVANGGVMPASPTALASAGMPLSETGFANSTAVAAPRLALLGDIWAVPAGWPLANVFSLGDVLLVVGAAVLLHRTCRSRRFPSALRGSGEVLDIPAFRRLWTAQAISNVGDWSYAVAVAVAVVDEGGGIRLFAVVLLVQALAGVCGGLISSTIVDRRDRRGVMMTADGLRAVAVLSLLLVPGPGAVHFCVVAAVLGVGGALFQPSMQASLPNIVPRARLVDANAVVAFTFQAAVVGGPVLGGLLVTHLGPRAAFGLNALSFLASLALLATVPLPAPVATVRQRTLEAVADGFRHVRSTRIVRAILVVTGIALFASAMRAPMQPAFVFDVLGGDAGILGLVSGAWGAGMLVGSAVVPVLTARWRLTRVLAGSIAVVGLAILATAVQVTVTPVVAAAVLGGAGNAVASVLYESLLQGRTPDHVRGRVLAACEVVDGIGYVLGAAFVALAGTLLGPQAVYVLSGLLFLAAAVHVLRSLPGEDEVDPLGADPAPVPSAAVPAG